MQSYGEIEFLQVGYPLVYKRSFQNQSIIAIINPADRKCCVEIPEGKIVYSVGGSGPYTHGTYLVDGATALFIEI